MPRMTRARSAGRSFAPRSNSSAYAETALTGVRSSCDASATNCRSCSSDAARRENASSMWRSIMLSDEPSRPTSVRLSSGTRRLRSPPAMLDAVVSMSRSGRRPMRTSQSPSADRRQQRGTRHHELDHDQLVQRAVDLVERERDQEVATVRQLLRPDPEPRTAVLRIHGEIADVVRFAEPREVVREARDRRGVVTAGRAAHQRVGCRRRAARRMHPARPPRVPRGWRSHHRSHLANCRSARSTGWSAADSRTTRLLSIRSVRKDLSAA